MTCSVFISWNELRALRASWMYLCNLYLSSLDICVIRPGGEERCYASSQPGPRAPLAASVNLWYSVHHFGNGSDSWCLLTSVAEVIGVQRSGNHFPHLGHSWIPECIQQASFEGLLCSQGTHEGPRMCFSGLGGEGGGGMICTSLHLGFSCSQGSNLLLLHLQWAETHCPYPLCNWNFKVSEGSLPTPLMTSSPLSGHSRAALLPEASEKEGEVGNPHLLFTHSDLCWAPIVCSTGGH